MPPYTWLHNEWLLLMLGFGLLLAIAVILARGSRVLSFSFTRRSERELEEDVHEFPGGLKEGNRPVPLLIWLLVFAYLPWAIAYTIYCSYYGVK